MNEGRQGFNVPANPESAEDLGADEEAKEERYPAMIFNG